MSIPDEVLMAYADGELDSKTRAEVESAMAADPQVERRVAEHKALRDRLRTTYNPVMDEPVPERLLVVARRGKGASGRGVGSAVGGGTTGAVGHADTGKVAHSDASAAADGDAPAAGRSERAAVSNVVPLRRRAPQTRARSAFPYWGAIAASFVVGVLVWHFSGELFSPDPVVTRNGQLLAAGALDAALSTQLVKDQQPQSPVQIGVSFRSKTGSYCRTFQLHAADSLAGVACRNDGKWKLEVLAHTDNPATGHPEFRPAGSSLPAAVARTVDDTINGEPLDAEAEANAKAGKWESR